MTLKTSMYVPAAFALLLTSPVLAQATDPLIDVNGDGMYSFPEVQAIMPEMTEDQFTVLDTSGDGLLDADEITVGVEAGILPVSDG
ncbi:hypothetical protein [Yoonia sp. 208BN28-4]|uniref:hypothetical protein n=1 Tax=Yoonia sp. 208BN28-4 TaxID=3126505 RepID=UPI00309951E4